jgi:NADH-quinone oxidoreductase subunit D
MESVISHFKLNSEYQQVRQGLAYQYVESPKGHFGTYIVADGSNTPYRCKVRTPVAHNMNIIPSVCSGLMFADMVATFCSLDIVLGEIDR